MNRFLSLIALTAFSLAVFLPFAAMSSDTGSGLSLVKIAVQGREAVARIASLGFDIASVDEDGVTVVATQEEIQAAGFGRSRMRTLLEDADQIFAPYRGRADAGAYHTYEETVAALKAAVKSNPKIASMFSIGKSIEGREIYCLKISDNVAKDEDEPEALYMGLHHSREWISVEVPLAIMNALMNGYGKDDQITKLVNDNEVFLIPIVNPDGLVYSQTNSKMWRKNRRSIQNGRYFGVDPNRNYGYQWGTVGASTSPYSDTYHGEKAFSEPETSAVRDFVKSRNFVSSISYHSYSRLVLYPFGYGYNIPNPEEDTFIALSKGIGQRCNYRPQNSAELYPAMGDCDDWLYGDQNLLCFTVEIGRTFVPSESEIPDICKRNVDGALWLLSQIGEHFPRVKGDKYARLTLRASLAEYRALGGGLASGMMSEREMREARSCLRLLADRILADTMASSDDWDAFVSYMDLLDEADMVSFKPVTDYMSQYLNSFAGEGIASEEARAKLETLARITAR
ncbi:MAG: hypothetical protein CVV64_03245 [Candidatus Wallbacteria bacterium HGW-Wallbacteria-1]|jgi:hypothetical protein|uniref:carboxypeptidase T n=1 Tax=Candidatus Wallbacteria bacterium HGW-Wallbacteria-1 TaxID=2013854 RepID=A0A2N1PTU1_9BACT|nr:MAG: hypothetical protein CVV64_03245 [Candidatus Wallbacteria bacterium HGW-Wallbacteria-1]